jgi:AcrR family transcriptional regulator
MTSAPVLGPALVSRREQQKEQTRLDLALAAIELAKAHGLANVRVPEIAAVVGVSTRTFNNYFPSKEAAIVWPATLRGARLADNLAARPAAEPLTEALVAAVGEMYADSGIDGLPPGWLSEFRALLSVEPSLHGEHRKAAAAAETALADAIARRTGAEPGQLEALVLAVVVVGAERAGVLHWARQGPPSTPLVDAVRAAVDMAVRGTAARLLSRLVCPQDVEHGTLGCVVGGGRLDHGPDSRARVMVLSG